jgi:hypothetical protein
VSACLKNLALLNTLSDIANIENDTEVIFVHALNRSRYILNNFLLVFSHFRKKLDILISIASFFGNSFLSAGMQNNNKTSCVNLLFPFF